MGLHSKLHVELRVEPHMRLHMDLHMCPYRAQRWADRRSPDQLIVLHLNKVKTPLCIIYMYIRDVGIYHKPVKRITTTPGENKPTAKQRRTNQVKPIPEQPDQHIKPAETGCDLEENRHKPDRHWMPQKPAQTGYAPDLIQATSARDGLGSCSANKVTTRKSNSLPGQDQKPAQTGWDKKTARTRNRPRQKTSRTKNRHEPDRQRVSQKRHKPGGFLKHPKLNRHVTQVHGCNTIAGQMAHDSNP